MDQHKIGNYIADRRKALDMTQVQLAEKLGVSNKSVSKWERGVNLPDVSLYESLCNTLGITINEFLAGEDLEPAEALLQADRNIVDVTRIGKVERNTLRKIIAVLVMAIILLGASIVWFLVKEGRFANNYIRSYEPDSTEYETLQQFPPDDFIIYKYSVDKDFTELQINTYGYEYGSDKPEQIDSTALSTLEYQKGTISIKRDESGEITISAGNYETMISSSVDIESNWKKIESSGVASAHTETVESIRPNKEYAICAYYYHDGEIDAILPEEFYLSPERYLKENEHCVLVTASFKDGGSADIAVPNLKGMTLEEAEIKLEETGLTINSTTANGEYKDDSKVVVNKQFPEAGKKVHKGAGIDLGVEVPAN